MTGQTEAGQEDKCFPAVAVYRIYVHRVYQAKDAVNEAQRSDPDSIFTQFSVYKVAMLENNVEKGIWKISSDIYSY